MRRFVPLIVSVLFVLVPATAAHAAVSPCKPGSGAKLRGKDFTNGATLPLNLRCADLTRATFDEVDLTQKDLTGAILRDASFKEADLTQAHLEYADLRGADFSDADLGQLQAKHADLRGAVLTDAHAGQAQFPHADLTGAVLTRAELTQANLVDAKLAGADLRNATLGQIKARTADFTKARLNEAKMGQAELQNAVLKDADLREAELTQADLDGADLHGADVGKTSFIQAEHLNLTGTHGAAKDVPDDAIKQAPAGDGDEDGDGDTPVSAGRPVSRPPTALVLVILGGLGLSLTLLIWGVSHRRKERFVAAMAVARHRAEEDVVRFGEEIDALDFDMKVSQISGPADEWRAALDAYEAARRVLDVAQTPYELAGAATAVAQGRRALEKVRTRLSDTGGQR
ncbi:pentapeptide repeat-containing protein [Microbispora sp. RL4-1S]|uniref:Pentapeptide repeat-containing protein n=1 Tax=Microbispora oryzae TaxID=2806554 RepID=A0A940WK36_9ACTN|nr:pentapeptide repeat-containing protein [Microbispora oryzae]MBP2704737.1 pentapeptide repeat-containing protein [Microbispora oryzae]